MYALTKRKDARTYAAIFQAVVNQMQATNMQPSVTQFRPDFEKAQINAALDVLNVESIQGCFFHFAQANWRNVQKSGLRELYIKDEEFSLHVRMMTSLAFVPEEDIPPVRIFLLYFCHVALSFPF